MNQMLNALRYFVVYRPVLLEFIAVPVLPLHGEPGIMLRSLFQIGKRDGKRYRLRLDAGMADMRASERSNL